MEKIIEINVDAFIVPNRINSCLDYSEISRNRVVEHLLQFNKMNDTTCDVVTEPMVQLWFTGKDSCNSTDLQSHGFTVGSTRMHLKPWSELVPLSFLRNKTEGETVPIKLTAYVNNITDESKETECVVVLNCRLAQREYRYRREGNFEDCLGMLIRDYQTRHGGVEVTA